MRQRTGKYNPKRSIAPPPSDETVARLRAAVNYRGNPEHKQNPGDFGLDPPAAARPGKTLCDVINLFKKQEAEALLWAGVEVGMISEQFRGEGEAGLPQNIWAVTDAGVAVEAQLENRGKAEYHGYPMPQNDPFLIDVLRAWAQRRNRRVESDT